MNLNNKNWKHNFYKELTPKMAFKIQKGSGISLKEFEERALDNSSCEVCGRPVWRLVGLGLCFTCVTGESDASEDYELKLIQKC